MKYEDLFFCPCCDGETKIGVNARTDHVELRDRDCDEDCIFTDEQLLERYRDDQISRAERAVEERLSGDHGPLPLDTQLEKARRIKRSI